MIIVLLIDDCYKLLGTKRKHDIVILKRSFIEPKEIDRFINKYTIYTQMPETIAFGSNFETLCREFIIPNINSAFWLNYILNIVNLLGKCFVHTRL